MAKQLKPTQVQGVSQAAIAKKYGVNGGSVAAWYKTGCPRLPNGRYNPEAVDKWLRERDAKRDERASLKDQKTQAEIDRIQRDIKQRDIDIAKSLDQLHDRDECNRKQIELRVAESAILNSLSDTFLSAWPEAKAQAQWLEAQTDEMIEKLKRASD